MIVSMVAGSVAFGGLAAADGSDVAPGDNAGPGQLFETETASGENATAGSNDTTAETEPTGNSTDGGTDDPDAGNETATGTDTNSTDSGDTNSTDSTETGESVRGNETASESGEQDGNASADDSEPVNETADGNASSTGNGSVDTNATDTEGETDGNGSVNDSSDDSESGDQSLSATTASDENTTADSDSVSAQDAVTKCRTIDSGGTYQLATDNITETSGTCIDIDASGVTFDGNGNVIKDGTYDLTAVSVSADDVVVKNLSVREVGTAVDFNGVNNGRIENVNVEDDFGGVSTPSTDGTAITVTGGSNNEIRNNGIFDPGETSGDGIRISDSTSNLVVDNEIYAPYDAGIELLNADDNNVSKNEIDGAGLGSRNSNAGIRIGDFDGNPGDDNYLFDNKINGNGFSGSIPILTNGIVVRAGTGNELDTNGIRDAAGSAVVVADDDTTLVDNAMNYNGENGIFVDDDASNANLTDNTVRYAGREDGSAGVDVRGSSTTVVENTIESGDGRGLYVTSDASATEVENNTIRYNDGYAVNAESSVRATRTRLGSGASWVTVDGAGYAIDDGRKPATLPEERQDIGIYLDVSGADGISEVRTKYRDDAVSTVNESTLRLWQYNGSWAQSSDTGVDTDADIVSGNTTSPGGTVAPLANNTLPTANSTVSSTSLAPNEKVTFNASESADSDGEIVEYRWDFNGSGSIDRTTRSPTVTYQYSQTGDFDAEVTVVDDGDDTDSTTLSVSVREQPIADLSVSLTPTSIDANTTLNASNSTFAYGDITEYRWDFDGDGTVDETTTEPTANHTYPTTGDVSPTVTVVGNDGSNGTASVSLSVQENLPPTGTEGNSALSFTCNRGFAPGCANWVGDDISPFTQNFEDPDGEIVEYQWDFDGDGAVEETTSSGSTSHAYTETGTYDLTVTLVDDDGDTLSTTNDVSITERKTGSIAGTVTNASGDPVANAIVIVYHGVNKYGGTTTNASGGYELTDVAADSLTYNVTVDPAGYEADFQEFSVEENATETADFQLDSTDVDPGSGSVLLTVKDSDGSPIPDATVEVRNRTGVVTTDTTDGNGQTSYISLPATHHSITIKKSGYKTTTAVAAVSDGDISFVDAVPETDPAPFFDVVQIDSTNEPVTEGERLSVTATINNTGEESDTQPIGLSVNSTQRDSTTVSLESGETETVSLEWATDVGDADPYAAIVTSDNDSVPTPVVVQEVDVPANLSRLDIAAQGRTATVNESVKVPINVTVENAGAAQSSYTPTLTINDSSGATVTQSQNATSTLTPGENETVTFRPGTLSPGDYTVKIATDSNATTGNLDVTAVADTAPVLSDAGAVARDDGLAIVRDDDVVEVSVNVTDPGGSGISSVTADASGFGAGTVSLSETNADGVYRGTFTVNASKTQDSSEPLQITATNGDGETNSTKTEFALTLDTQPPVPRATANRTTIEPGETVRFNASGSTDDNFRGPVLHKWDFDADGVDEKQNLFYRSETVTYRFASAGTYTIELTVSDSAGNANTTSLTVDVGETNQAPTAANDTYVTPENTTLRVDAPGILGNDTDANTLNATLVSGPTNGTLLSLNANGSFSYTPDSGFTGTDSFTYNATDGELNDTATVTITVTESGGLPVISRPIENNETTFTETKYLRQVSFTTEAGVQGLVNATERDPPDQRESVSETIQTQFVDANDDVTGFTSAVSIQIRSAPALDEGETATLRGSVPAAAIEDPSSLTVVRVPDDQSSAEGLPTDVTGTSTDGESINFEATTTNFSTFVVGETQTSTGEFVVDINGTQTDDSVEPGATATVVASVTNTGDSQATQTVALDFGENTSTDSAALTLNGSESETVTLTHDVAADAPLGSPNATVRTANDSDSTRVEVADPGDDGPVPTVNTSASSVSPTTATVGDSQTYTVTVTVENTSLNDTEARDIEIQFEDFEFDEGEDDESEDDLTVGYTADDVTDGTVTVSESVSATAPLTAGVRNVTVTDLRREANDDETGSLLADANVTIDTIRVVEPDPAPPEAEGISFVPGGGSSNSGQNGSRVYSEKIVVATDLSDPVTIGDANSRAFRVVQTDTDTNESVVVEPESGVGTYNITGASFDIYRPNGTIGFSSPSSDRGPTLGVRLANGSTTGIPVTVSGNRDLFDPSRANSSVFDPYAVQLLAENTTQPSDSSVLAETDSRIRGIGYDGGPGTEQGLRQNSTEGTIEVSVNREPDVNASWDVEYVVASSPESLIEYVVTPSSNAAILNRSADNSGGNFTATFDGSGLQNGSYRHAFVIRPTEGSDEVYLKLVNGNLQIGDADGESGDSEGDSQQVDVDPSDLAGNGTEDVPYNISNASELQAMEDDLSANYTLVSDIDASNTAQWNNGSGFDPIGANPFNENESGFAGSLDGNNHTITGLVIDRPSENTTALLGGNEGTVSDVTLKNADITGARFMGGLVGINDGVIHNATVSGNVSSTAFTVGGLSGSNFGEVNNSHSSANVTGPSAVGGFVGYNVGEGSIRESAASGDVNGDFDVGGFVGTNIDGATIRNATASGTVDGDEVVGGFAGRNQNDSTIRNGEASGSVTGSNFVGGFIGFNSGSNITTATSSASVSVPELGKQAGGFVGLRSGGTIENATATGLVNGIDTIAIRHAGGGASGTRSASGDELDAEDLEVDVLTSGEFVDTADVTFGGDSDTALRIRNGTGRTVTIEPNSGEPNFVLTRETEIDLNIYSGDGVVDDQPTITVINDTGETFRDVNVTVSGNTSMFSSGVPDNTATTPSRPFDEYTIDFVNADGDTVSSTEPRLIGIGYNAGDGIEQNSTTGNVEFTIPRERTNEGINESWFARLSLGNEIENVPVENTAGDENFSVVVDVSDLSPGRYTSRFELYRQDPSKSGELADRVINVFGVNDVVIESTTEREEVNETASSVLPNNVTGGQQETFDVTVRIDDTSLTNDDTGEVDVRFEDFDLNAEGEETDLTIGYTGENVTDGTLIVSENVSATAPETAGTREISVTDLRRDTSDGTEFLIEDANVTIDAIEVAGAPGGEDPGGPVGGGGGPVVSEPIDNDNEANFTGTDFVERISFDAQGVGGQRVNVTERSAPNASISDVIQEKFVGANDDVAGFTPAASIGVRDAPSLGEGETATISGSVNASDVEDPSALTVVRVPDDQSSAERLPTNVTNISDGTISFNATTTNFSTFVVGEEEASTANVTGSLTAASGASLENDTVVVYRETADGEIERYNDTVDADGNFSVVVNSTNATYTLAFGDDERGTTPNGVPDLYAIEEVAPPEDVGEVTVPRAYNVTVRVTNDDGDPIENADVAVGHKNGNATIEDGVRNATNATGYLTGDGEDPLELVGNVTVFADYNGSTNETQVRVTDDREIVVELLRDADDGPDGGEDDSPDQPETQEAAFTLPAQATDSSTLNTSLGDETDPAVVATNVTSNVDGAIVVVYEVFQGADRVAGVEETTATETNGDPVTIPLENTTGLPGPHYAVFLNESTVNSTNPSPGDILSIQAEEEALATRPSLESGSFYQTIYEGEINVTDQQFTGSTDEITIDQSALQPDAPSGYVVVLHDQSSAPVGAPIGASQVLNGTRTNFSVTLDEEAEINTTQEVTAMLHFAANGSPGRAIPNADVDNGFVAGNVADSATITIAESDGPTQVDVDPSDLNGTGTEADPYEISNASELQAMEDDLSANYTLVSDVDASDTTQFNGGSGFDPIGDADAFDETEEEFNGSFDGNGRTITGLTINRSGEGNIGLFGALDSGTVTDVSLTGVTITGDFETGGLVGTARGNSTVENVSVSGSVSGTFDSGGVVGVAEDDTTIQNATAYVDVADDGGDSSAGGLVGGLEDNSVIQSATATGNVSGDGAVGGLVGRNGGTVRNVTASGSVSSIYLGFSAQQGGLVGRNLGTIRNATASGSVDGNSQVGGLAGSNSGEITNSTAVGDVTGGTTVAGLVGSNEGVISETTASGSVSGTETVGGLVAVNDGTIRNATASGSVDGEFSVGGLAGNNGAAGTVRNAAASGSVTAAGDFASNIGGLVGVSEGTVRNATASGNVAASDADEVGGLVGEHDGGTIRSAAAYGNVDGNRTVGGLVGRNANGTIRETFAVGSVNGSTDTGGLVGNNTGFSGTGTVTESYWDTEATGQGDSAGNATGRTTSEMQGQAATTKMTGLDFETTWRVTDGYPALRVFSERDDGDDTAGLAPSITAPSNVTYDPNNPLTIGTSHNATGVIDDSDVAIRMVNVTAGNDTQIALNDSVPVEGSANTTIPAGALAGNVTVETQLYNLSNGSDVASDTISLTANTTDDGGDGSGGSDGSDGSDGDTGDDGQAIFNVSSLEPRNITVTAGDPVTINATIENTGNASGTQTVEFRVAGNVSAVQNVTLGAGNETTVEFSGVDTAGLNEGTQQHGVFTEDTNQTGTLTIEPADDTDGGDSGDGGTDDTTPGFGSVVSLLALVLFVVAAKRRGD